MDWVYAEELFIGNCPTNGVLDKLSALKINNIRELTYGYRNTTKVNRSYQVHLASNIFDDLHQLESLEFLLSTQIVSFEDGVFQNLPKLNSIDLDVKEMKNLSKKHICGCWCINSTIHQKWWM